MLFFRRFSYKVIRLLPALLLVSTAYGQSSDTGVINFPATTNTFITKCDSAFLASPAGFVTLQHGQFILHDGLTVYATANAGFTGCTNFMALSFSPAASHVSFQLLNLNSLPDVLTVFKADGVVKYVLPPHGSAQVTADGNITSIGLSPQINNFSFGIAALTVTQPSPAVTELFAMIETQGTTPAKFRKQASASMKMQIALGTVFSLGLQRRAGLLEPVVTIPSIVDLSAGSVKPPQKLLPTASVVPRTITVFPNNSLVALAEKQFIAVHLGTQIINVLSTTTNLPPITLAVEVIPPGSLGTKNNSQDVYLSMVAHNTGIPPQLVKGQVLQEGDQFKLLNYRYEPCGSDLQEVTGGRRMAFTDPYSTPFRLDDAIGINIIPEVRDDLDPRSAYFIVRENQLSGQVEDRRITNEDRQVTAREIWDANDKLHRRINWSDYCKPKIQEQIDQDDSPTLDFVAQTVLASSYGLQQVMWEEAAKPDFWDGVEVIDIFGNKVRYKAPKFLFDRPEYINIGGGSVQIGLNKIAQAWLTGFKLSGKPRIIFATTFSSYDEFESAASGAFRTYNWWFRDPKTQKAYGPLVVEKSRIFPPTQSESVFP